MKRLALLVVGAGVCLAADVDFQRDVRPLLARKCFACHGPDDGARKANLRLDTFDFATGKAGTYPAIVPGSSAKSRVLARVTHATKPMPPAGERLNEAEVAALRKWIDSGARYEQHWAFEKPVRPEVPAVRKSGWARNPIDAFVLARLEREGLAPSAEADRRTLARRVALDLTGVPPSPADVAAFVADKRADAYERFVDAQLASPRYGERWARVWLDLARYADTQGYEKDNARTIWPWRDWVIRAFNSNLPFDQFTRLQLAGDLLPKASEDDLIATGFHRNTMTNTEGGTDDEEFRDAAIRDRVAVTGQVWMGMTWGCAQCHSHKFDPISHKEFYQLYAFLNQTEDSDKPSDVPVLKTKEGVSTLIFRELPADKRRKTHIFERGNFLSPGAEVEAGVPSAFAPLPAGASANRLGLAEWLVSKENPLTARVQVNRFWARLFGRGLVESEEDFGTQGLPPTHPELMDWLAVEFMDSGWDMKRLLRTMVLSATYRQSSDVSKRLLEKDPNNKLLARGARFRLEAEMVRDQALAVSGLLSSKMFGASVMPWQPEGIWSVVYSSDKWTVSPGEDRYRRGLYTFARRTSPYPSMMAFDAPTGETCTIRRIRTNTPLQALATLNDPVSMEASERLAMRVLGEKAPGAPADVVKRMFEQVLLRAPDKVETEKLLALHRTAAAKLAHDAAGASKLLSYDRLIYEDGRRTTLLLDSRAKGQAPVWRYTTDEPAAEWMKPEFDAASWKSAPMAFGLAGRDNTRMLEKSTIGTPWEDEGIWVRTEFDVPPGGVEKLTVVVQSQGGFEAYINGVRAALNATERGGFYEFPVSAEALRAVRAGAKNVIALHGYRSVEKVRGQLLDVSVDALLPAKLEKPDATRAAWVVVANTVLNLDETLTRR